MGVTITTNRAAIDRIAYYAAININNVAVGVSLTINRAAEDSGVVYRAAGFNDDFVAVGITVDCTTSDSRAVQFTCAGDDESIVVGIAWIGSLSGDLLAADARVNDQSLVVFIGCQGRVSIQGVANQAAAQQRGQYYFTKVFIHNSYSPLRWTFINISYNYKTLYHFCPPARQIVLNKDVLRSCSVMFTKADQCHGAKTIIVLKTRDVVD